MSIDGNCVLGALDTDLSAVGGPVGGTAISAGSANGAVVFAALDVSGSFDDIRALEALDLAAAGLTGEVGNGSIVLQALSAAGAGITGGAGVGDIRLEALDVSGGSGIVGSVLLEALQLSASGVSGGVGTGAAVLSALQLSAGALSQGLGAGDIAFEALQLSGTASGSGVGSGAVVLMALDASGTGRSGGVGTAAIVLPALDLSGTFSGGNGVGVGVLVLPALDLNAQVSLSLPPVTLAGVALNTRTKAVSTYAGLSPNSIARFNGVTLMATANGIVALTGNTDLGVPISAWITSGKTTFGLQGMKRVLTGYVGYRAGGDMELTLIGDDHHEYSYRMEPRRIDQQHQSRVKFGRGAKAVYWQWKVANTDGADFALDRLELHTAATGEGV